MNPVFKYGNKLVKYQCPIPNRLVPFLFDFVNGQIDRFFQRIIIWKWQLIFGVLSNFPIQIFNKISGIDNLSNLDGEIKEHGQFFPIISP